MSFSVIVLFNLFWGMGAWRNSMVARSTVGSHPKVWTRGPF